MPSVQLAGGKQVQRRREHPYPGGRQIRTHAEDTAVRNVAEEQGSGEREEQGKPQEKIRISGRVERENPGVAHSIQEDREGHDKSCEGSRDTDVKERFTVGNPISNANEGAERAQDGNPGKKIREARTDLVMTAGQVMPQLVGQ